jgi:excisionase family DNA binding protein
MRMACTDDFLKLFEAADILRVDESTLRRWIARGDFPAARTPGGQYRIARADLQLALGPAHRRDAPPPESVR